MHIYIYYMCVHMYIHKYTHIYSLPVLHRLLCVCVYCHLLYVYVCV